MEPVNVGHSDLLERIESVTGLKKQYLQEVQIKDVEGVTYSLCADVMVTPLHFDNVNAARLVFPSFRSFVYGAISTSGYRSSSRNKDYRVIVCPHCWIELEDGTHIDPSILCQPVINGHVISLSDRTYFEAFKISKEEFGHISKSILPPKLIGSIGIPLESLSDLDSHSYLFRKRSERSPIQSI